MINHKDFDTDCKRIAKEIQFMHKKYSSDPEIFVVVSKPMLYEFIPNETKYLKGINKQLKDFKVEFINYGYGIGAGHGLFLKFDIIKNPL